MRLLRVLSAASCVVASACVSPIVLCSVRLYHLTTRNPGTVLPTVVSVGGR